MGRPGTIGPMTKEQLEQHVDRLEESIRLIAVESAGHLRRIGELQALIDQRFAALLTRKAEAALRLRR